VRIAASALSAQIQPRVITVKSLAEQATASQPEQLEAILSTSVSLLSDFDGGLAFFNAEGSLLAFSGNREVWENSTADVFPPLRAILSEGKEQVVSTTFVHPADGRALVLVIAVAPGGNLAAVGAFDPAGLMTSGLAKILPSPAQMTITVVDSNAQVLYQRGELLEKVAGNQSGVAEALRGESGVVYRTVAKEEHVVAYSPVTPFGWGLTLEESWEMVSSPALRATQVAPLVLAPALLMALGGLWFGARQIVQPLQQLESKAISLAWGNFKAIEEPVGGIAEIRRLQVELAHMAAKVQAAQKSLHDYIGVITSAQEEERRRLARELHDDTLQALIALKQRVQLAQMALCDAPARRSLEEIETLTDQTIENLRRLTRALRPIYLEDLGLTPALEMLARDTAQAMGAPVDFHQFGVERRLTAPLELALYRMAQEALSNVSRHARATRAALHITFAPQTVILEVSDNGQGFEVPKSPAEFASAGHFGLLGLYERADLLGARFEIQSTVGQGTRLTIQL
jgi:signal transduction histidine kinase